MAENESPRSSGGHGDIDDRSQAGCEVNHELIPQPRQQTSSDSWADRHRRRINKIFDAADQRTDDDHWSASELRAAKSAAAHLRSLGLYGSWQTSQGARAAWRCQRCPCQRRQVA
jgi:hypothetical protein